MLLSVARLLSTRSRHSGANKREKEKGLVPFNHDILNITAHRPWPMPSSPWVMTQTWHDLLFAHWPVDAAVLREKIPSQFELDQFDGQAWLGVVPFHMSNVSPRGVPALPWISAFPELNVRTYVRVGGVPGVYFFSLDAANPAAVAIARTMFHLPYFSAAMKVEERDGWIDYASHRDTNSGPGAEFVGRYRPVGEPRPPVAGTLEYLPHRALLPVHRRRIIPLVPSRHPSPAMAAAKCRSADLRQHDGPCGRHSSAGSRAAPAFLEASRHGGVVTEKAKGRR